MSNKRKQSQPTDLWLLYSWAEVLRSHRWPRRPHCGDSYVCREPVWCSRLWNAPRRCTSRCPRGWVPCPHRNTPSHEPLPNHWRRHRDTGSSFLQIHVWIQTYKGETKCYNIHYRRIQKYIFKIPWIFIDIIIIIIIIDSIWHSVHLCDCVSEAPPGLAWQHG